MPDSWNRIADRYAQVAGTEADVPYQKLKTPLWDALGELAGKRVLDIGCGTGWLSEAIRGHGAVVVGIDGSSRLLAMGRERFPDLRLIEHDLRKGLPRLDSQFDIAIAQMVLMDFDPIAPAIEDVASILRPDGRFIVTLTHPAFFGYPTDIDDEGVRVRKVSRYLETYRTNIETFGGHVHYHRPLSYYLNVLADSGFVVTRFVEPEQHDAFPVFCLIEARLA